MRQTSNNRRSTDFEPDYNRLPDITEPIFFDDESYTAPKHLPGVCDCINCERFVDLLFIAAYKSQGEA